MDFTRELRWELVMLLLEATEWEHMCHKNQCGNQCIASGTPFCFLQTSALKDVSSAPLVHGICALFSIIETK